MPSLEPILTAILVAAMLEIKPAPKRGPRLYLFAAIVLQYLISTAHWICTIFYTRRDFVILGGGLPAVLAELEGDAHGEPLTVLFTLSGFLSNLFAIHRVSVVWKTKLTAILLPSFLMVVYVAAGIALQIGGNTAGYPLVTTSSVLSLVVTTYSTALIAWKIWRIHSASIPADTGRAEKTLMVKLMVKPSKIALLIAAQAFLGVITESYALQT
ncbi:hypothetical protein B0H14DRAFT_3468695 [Mycena olivaceomarginata]|nr:hypothetical protein B0H14DRAFT_3468695 [Mycena olivaceomarginata]